MSPGRLPRGVVLYVVLIATALGVVALTASWTPRWGVDVLAGTRVVVTPAATDASRADLESTADSLEQRAHAAGAPGAAARVRSDGALSVSLPGQPDGRVLDALRATGRVEVRLVLAGSTPPPVVLDEEDVTGGSGGDRDGADEVPGADDEQDETGEPAPGAGLPGGVAVDPPVEPVVPACPVPGRSVDVDGVVVACGPQGGSFVLGTVLAAEGDVTGAEAVLEEGLWGVRLHLGADAATRLAGAAALVEAHDGPLLAARQARSDAGARAETADEGGEDEPTRPALEPVRLALTVDDELVLVSPNLPTAAGDAGGGADGAGGDAVPALPDAGSSEPGTVVLLGALDQEETSVVAARAAEGSLPVEVATVDVVRLGSTLGPDEGARGAVAGLLAGALGLLAALGALRRRALPLVATATGTALASVPGVLLVDQVVGLPLGLPVAVAGMVAGAAALVVPAVGREAWPLWWPVVATSALGGLAVRVVVGGEPGDVGTMLATVLACALVTVRLVTLPLLDLPAPTAGPRTSGGGADIDIDTDTGRRRSAGVVAGAVLVAAAVAGVLLPGVAADPAFVAGDEHAVTVDTEPAAARAALRDAVVDAGITVSSVRTAGPDTVLLTTPRLDEADRATLAAALAEVEGVAAPVGTVGVRAAGDGDEWTRAALVLGAALLVGVATAAARAARDGRRPAGAVALRALAGVLLAPLVGVGLAAWAGLTWSPAAVAALGAVAVVAAATLAPRAGVRSPDDGGVRLVAALAAVLPLLAVAVAAPSVRPVFLLAAVGVATVLLGAAYALPPRPHARPDGSATAGTDPAPTSGTPALAGRA
ncbi:hypothetical protein RDV89_05505 [Nocardioides zeae]|uniref:Membrane transport protein MMPL domain-containing protein n=1 Tax=Nocardioides imazamoxiresistens TaxID=3231893 RepID=A0ABU3PTI2_9ACTN|nr:hypothetical protein [Nocardioides zeae]MDT9592513.1 hypothetical protein [Nocardioides zeae]